MTNPLSISLTKPTRSGSRRGFLLGAAASFLGLIHRPSWADVDSELDARFAYLSTHGNNNCSVEFMQSIQTMPITASLQGSCCAPMDRAKYKSQRQGLRAFSHIPEIPPDPYDIPAGVAQKMLMYYSLNLATAEQPAYQYAMEHSEEKGPCCCQCWRWHVLGGLAKFLIREHAFSGPQVTQIWDLTNGCGGA